MNKPYAYFQKYRMNHLFKTKFMYIKQNTRLYMYFPLKFKCLSSKFKIKIELYILKPEFVLLEISSLLSVDVFIL